MISALNQAVHGMQLQQRAMSDHANRISRWGTQDVQETPSGEMVNLQEEISGMMQAQRGFEANLPVLRVADEMLGSLLDVLA